MSNSKKDITNEIIELTESNIKDMIYEIRGQKVMLDFDLARIYGYETKRFNEQIKNNKEKFPKKYRFRLTKVEFLNFVRSKKSTAQTWIIGNKGGRTSLPYAFTEQGVYMLMTVLKGKLATKQSIALIDCFKAMKDYIQENTHLLGVGRFNKLENKVEKNINDIKQIKGDLKVVMDNFVDQSKYKHFLLLNGERIESDIAYQSIYKLAKKNVIIVDDYISLKTLQLLKVCDSSITIDIYSDNKSKDKITDELLNDFVLDSEMRITVKPNNGRFHDRYVFIDYLFDNFKVFHCGTSSKDAGNKIHTIVEIKEIEPYITLLNKIF